MFSKHLRIMALLLILTSLAGGCEDDGEVDDGEVAEGDVARDQADELDAVDAVGAAYPDRFPSDSFVVGWVMASAMAQFLEQAASLGARHLVTWLVRENARQRDEQITHAQRQKLAQNVVEMLLAALIQVALQYVDKAPGLKPAYIHVSNSSIDRGFSPANAAFEKLE